MTLSSRDINFENRDEWARDVGQVMQYMSCMCKFLALNSSGTWSILSTNSVILVASAHYWEYLRLLLHSTADVTPILKKLLKLRSEIWLSDIACVGH